MQLFYASSILEIVVFILRWWRTDWSEVINLNLHRSHWLYTFFKYAAALPNTLNILISLNLFFFNIKAEKAEGNNLSSKHSCIDANFSSCLLQFHILWYFLILTQCLPLSCFCPLSSLYPNRPYSYGSHFSLFWEVLLKVRVGNVDVHICFPGCKSYECRESVKLLLFCRFLIDHQLKRQWIVKL